MPLADSVGYNQPMADFNPYHKWLGIPPDQQPASHYRLLGIEEFEFDADVIDAAAEQRTVFLRTFQTGPNAELAERLLNEISAARVCLLDGKSKARYDQRLKEKQQPNPVATQLPKVASDAAPRTRRPAADRATPWYQTPWAAASGGAIVMLLIMLLFGSGEEPKEPANQSTNTTPGNQPKTQPTANNKTLPAKVAVAPPLGHRCRARACAPPPRPPGFRWRGGDGGGRAPASCGGGGCR